MSCLRCGLCSGMDACSGARHGARIWSAAFLGRLVLWCFCTSLGMYQNSHQECCLAAAFSVLRVCSSSVLPYALGPCSLPTTSACRYVASDNQAVVFCGVAAKHGWLFCWGRCHLRTWHPVIDLLHGQGCIAVAGMAQRHQRAWLLVTVLHGHQEACLVGMGRGCLSWCLSWMRAWGVGV